MNQSQVMSIVRGALQIVGALLIAYGFVSDVQWEPIAGGILSLLSFGWGMWTHTNANAVATAAAIPEVAKVEIKMTPEGMVLKEAAGSKPDALVVFTPS